MNEYLITFRALTAAQQAHSALSKHAVPSELRRTPRVIAARGCGYSVAVSDAQHALRILRERSIAYSKIFRILPDGSVEEVAA